MRCDTFTTPFGHGAPTNPRPKGSYYAAVRNTCATLLELHGRPLSKKSTKCRSGGAKEGFAVAEGDFRPSSPALPAPDPRRPPRAAVDDDRYQPRCVHGPSTLADPHICRHSDAVACVSLKHASSAM